MMMKWIGSALVVGILTTGLGGLWIAKAQENGKAPTEASPAPEATPGAAQPKPDKGPKLIAEGEWSKPVTAANKRYKLRGRLALYDVRDLVAIYVELQDATEAVGGTMRILFDLGGLREGGLHCELHDKDKRPVESTMQPWDGPYPQPVWVTLPWDATIRVRANPFNTSKEKGMVIATGPGTQWVIDDGDSNEYFLSGTFTVDPKLGRDEYGRPTSDEIDIWRGKIDLPAVRIVNQRK